MTLNTCVSALLRYTEGMDKDSRVEQNPRTHYERVKGYHKCAEPAVMAGLGRWKYPWEHMKPGGVFFLPDPSPEARTRMATAASAVRRRTGMCFTTGPSYGLDGAQDGWWCCRWDSCELLPVERTLKQEWDAKQKAERKQARRAKYTASRFKPHARPGAVSELGDYAPEVREPLVEGDYTGWSDPVKPGDEF